MSFGPLGIGVELYTVYAFLIIIHFWMIIFWIVQFNTNEPPRTVFWCYQTDLPVYESYAECLRLAVQPYLRHLMGDWSQIAEDHIEKALDVSVSVMRRDMSIDLVISMILTVLEECGLSASVFC